MSLYLERVSVFLSKSLKNKKSRTARGQIME